MSEDLLLPSIERAIEPFGKIHRLSILEGECRSDMGAARNHLHIVTHWLQDCPPDKLDITKLVEHLKKADDILVQLTGG